MNGNNEYLSVSFKKSHRSTMFRTALKLVFLKKKKEKKIYCLNFQNATLCHGSRCDSCLAAIVILYYSLHILHIVLDASNNNNVNVIKK